MWTSFVKSHTASVVEIVSGTVHLIQLKSKPIATSRTTYCRNIRKCTIAFFRAAVVQHSSKISSNTIFSPGRVQNIRHIYPRNDATLSAGKQKKCNRLESIVFFYKKKKQISLYIFNVPRRLKDVKFFCHHEQNDELDPRENGLKIFKQKYIVIIEYS